MNYYTDGFGQIHEFDSEVPDNMTPSTDREIYLHLQIKGLERGITELYTVIKQITDRLGILWLASVKD